MKKVQWLTLGAGLLVTALLFVFGKRLPGNGIPKYNPSAEAQQQAQARVVTIDTILLHARENLQPGQQRYLNNLETTLSKTSDAGKKAALLHDLAHFWRDSAGIFEPYAWYESEGARLENSEKSLTFAAHLLLANLRRDNSPGLRQWKATQAKDLFERSLKINPGNDSAAVGLGACYIFGNIAPQPMEGIMKVRAVVEKDSNNLFAQDVLAYGSMLSGQYDKAALRFEKVFALAQGRKEIQFETALALADINERSGNKAKAVQWYRQSLSFTSEKGYRDEIEKRIAELNK